MRGLADQHDHVISVVARAERDGTMREHLLEALHALYDAERRLVLHELAQRSVRVNNGLDKNLSDEINRDAWGMEEEAPPVSDGPFG